MFGFNHLSIIDIAHSHLRGPPEAPDRYTCWCSTANLAWSCVTSCAPSTALCSPRDGDGEAISPAIPTGAPGAAAICAACSHSRFQRDTSPANCSARRSFSIKPLFIATGGGTAVASEEMPAGPRPVMGFDTEIDHRALQHYTVLQYVPGTRTLHREGTS